MAFELVQHRIAGLRHKPCSIRLLLRKTSLHDARPACKIGIRKDFAAGLMWKQNDPIKCEIGTEDDAGKLRLSKDEAHSIARVRIAKGGVTLDLGHIPQFGMTPTDKTGVDAVIVDGALIITLPDWGKIASAEEDDRHDEPEIPRRPAPPPPSRPATVPKPAANGAVAHLFSFKGVEISFDPENECISLNDKTMELTAKQARLLAALARATPHPVDRDHLIQKIWEGSTIPKTADEVLSMIVSDLRAPLATIDIDLKTVRGVGLSLQWAGSQ